MKNSKPFLGLLLLGIMSSCSNNESAYNEKAASLFVSEMKQIDDTQQSFADSARVLHADASDIILLTTKADNTVENAQQDIQNMNDLKHSDAAKEFDASVIRYFTLIKNYGTTAKAMLTASSQDKKKELYTHLMNQYKDLITMPDEVLEIQKQYFSKVGLKGKE